MVLTIHGKESVSNTPFLPRSMRPNDVRALVGMVACAVRGRTAVYVSTPITTGRRFIDWYVQRPPGLIPDSPGYHDERRSHVVEPNLAHAASAIQRIRASLNRVVLDPSAVEFVDWEQADYHELWATVIERYADTVVFLDGWEYSEGCTYEFLTALRSGAHTLREDLTPLTLADARAGVREAVRIAREHDVPMRLLDIFAQELTNFSEELRKS